MEVRVRQHPRQGGEQTGAAGGKGGPSGELVELGRQGQAVDKLGVLHRRHGGQQGQHPAEALVQQTGVIIAIGLLVEPAHLQQRVQVCAGAGQGEKVAVPRRQLPELGVQRPVPVLQAHEKSAHQQLGPISHQTGLGHFALQQQGAGLLHRAAGHGLVHQRGHDAAAPAPDPQLPDQTAVLLVDQIRPLA